MGCKFIIVAHAKMLYLIFGPVSIYPYHANLLGRFCQQREIRYQWVKMPDLVKIQEPEYRVLGGGYLEIDPSEKRLKFSGSSKAYGFFELDDVRLITSRDELFSTYSILVKS